MYVSSAAGLSVPAPWCRGGRTRPWWVRARCRGHQVGQAQGCRPCGCRELASDGLRPVRSLIATLPDHEPSADEIRRIQAQENQREDLTLADQQAQFADCWIARAGLPDSDRIAAV